MAHPGRKKKAKLIYASPSSKPAYIWEPTKNTGTQNPATVTTYGVTVASPDEQRNESKIKSVTTKGKKMGTKINQVAQVDYNNGHIVSSQELHNRLQQFAVNNNKRIEVTGGDRTPTRNQAVGGATQSRHLFGECS